MTTVTQGTFDPVAMVRAGLSVIPIRQGSKAAAVEWTQFQTTPATIEQVQGWQAQGFDAYAFVCGAVSGGLEIIDIDDNDIKDNLGEYWTGEAMWRRFYNEAGHILTMHNIPLVQTPGGGYQYLYRRASGAALGNLKLAHAPDTNPKNRAGRLIAIETRGEGGYALAPGSNHPDGGTYKFVSGSLDTIPTIPDEAAEKLLDIARELCEAPFTKHELRAMNEQRHTTSNGDSDGKIWDRFNRENPIKDLLKTYGYTNGGAPNRLSRPGAKDSMGVSLFTDNNLAMAHSTNDPLYGLGAGGAVDPAEVIIQFEYGGDRAAAYKAEGRKQYLADNPGAKQPVSAGEDEARERKVKGDAAADKSTTKTGRATAIQETLSGMGYEFRFNEASWRIEVNDEELTDGKEAQILTKLYDAGCSNNTVMRTAIIAKAQDNAYHPIKDYLNGLEWDGKNHMDKLASYFTDSHPHIVYGDGTSRQVFRTFLGRWLIGVVDKVLTPPDRRSQNPMLVIDGAQGIGKSYLFKHLASPFISYFREAAIQPDNKDSLLALADNLIWEVMELGSTTRKADREALKGFITLDTVDERAPYGRYSVKRPVMASLAGTINNETGFLNDPTGSRRFRTVNITAIDWRYRDDVDIDQVWAQAVHILRNGGTPDLLPVEDEMRITINGDYDIESHTAGMLVKLFSITPGAGTGARFMRSEDITNAIAAQVKTSSSKALQMDIGGELKRMGATKGRMTIDGVKVRGYFGIEKRNENIPFE